MGIENNESVIAVTWSDGVINDIKDWVVNNEDISNEERSLFVFIPSIVNGKTTLFMAPNGSKKGWDIAERFEKIRNNLINYFESFEYEDGSSPIEWIEVGWGEFGQKVLRGNNKNQYSDDEYAG